MEEGIHTVAGREGISHSSGLPHPLLDSNAGFDSTSDSTVCPRAFWNSSSSRVGRLFSANGHLAIYNIIFGPYQNCQLKSQLGAGAMAQWVKPWPVPVWVSVHVLAVPLLIQLPTNGLGKQQMMTKVLGPLHPH